MKILFYSIHNTCIPVFAQELETIADFIKNGDEIYLLRCHGELELCDLNINHDARICKLCNKSFYKNIKLINFNKKNLLRIPKLDISYDFIPDKFDNVQDLIDFSYEGIKLGLCTASTLISEFKDHDFDTKIHKELINRALRVAFFTYNVFSKFLKELNPDMVCFEGGRSSTSFPIYQLCKKNGIKTCSIVGAGLLTKYQRLINHLPFELDNYTSNIEELWKNAGDDKFEIGSKWFIDKRGRKNVEWSSHVNNQRKGLLPDGFDFSKKNIAIYNSSMYEYFAVEGLENKIYKDELEGLEKIFNSLKDVNIFFYLRVHPNMKGSNSSQMKNLIKLDKYGYKNLRIIWPEENIDSYALMDASDKVLVFSSTMGAEACFWGKPSILAGRDTTYRRLDCCYKPETHEELVEIIQKDLKPKPKEEAIKFGFWKMTYGIDHVRYVPNGICPGRFLGHSMEVKDFKLYMIYFIDNLNIARVAIFNFIKNKPILNYFYKLLKRVKDKIILKNKIY